MLVVPQVTLTLEVSTERCRQNKQPHASNSRLYNHTIKWGKTWILERHKPLHSLTLWCLRFPHWVILNSGLRGLWSMLLTPYFYGTIDFPKCMTVHNHQGLYHSINQSKYNYFPIASPADVKYAFTDSIFRFDVIA